MTTINLIKKHLPNIKNAHRKEVAKQIESASKVSGKSILEIILEAEKKVNEQGKIQSEILLHKILATGLLIETNDELQGTLFDRYYCKITGGIGKRFMNAQYKLYRNEYDSLLATKFEDVSYLTEMVNRCVKILAKVMRTDNVKNLDILEAMQSDEVLQKRIEGIYNKHLRNE